MIFFLSFGQTLFVLFFLFQSREWLEIHSCSLPNMKLIQEKDRRTINLIAFRKPIVVIIYGYFGMLLEEGRGPSVSILHSTLVERRLVCLSNSICDLGLKSSKGSYIECLVSSVAVYRDRVSGKWLDHGDSDLMNGFIHVHMVSVVGLKGGDLFKIKVSSLFLLSG